jgi:very-short-patch-repair endonuclease
VGEGKEQPLSLVFAIPDHPWVDAAEGASVRIAMTVAVSSESAASGLLREVENEAHGQDGDMSVVLIDRRGRINPDVTLGADVSRANRLRSNRNIACPGVQLSGQGFVVEVDELAFFSEATNVKLIKRYLTGGDLTKTSKNRFVIDTFGLGTDDLLLKFPDAYQWLRERVWPERQENARESYRAGWWLHAEPRSKFRKALQGLDRFAVTSRTAKHRFFSFVGSEFLPETKVLIVALRDHFYLGVISSYAHTFFAQSSGGWHGVGNDLTYNHSDCFEKFPFPLIDCACAHDVRRLAENLDTHRKRQQAAHPDLTLTGMYNVLDKLRSGEPLSAKERVVHEHGLVSVLRQIHDELDAAVLDAYGWSDLLPLLRVAHDNGTPALLPSPTGRGAGGEGESRRRLPKAPLPQETIAFARTLRREQTDAETLMWMLLRDRRLHGMKFRRQHPVPPYTLDFYCHPLKLAVELDGSQHLDSARDQARDAALNEAGIEVLRYWNHDVLARTEQVLDDLWNRIDHRSDVIAGGTAAAEPSPPAPLPVGEGSAMTRDDAKRAFDDAVLERLVALNAERAAEEARGIVRWLRPEFQNPQATPTQQAIDTGPEEDPVDDIVPTINIKPQPWPKDAVAQVRAVADALSASAVPLSLDEIAARFTARGPWKKRLPQLLDMLVAMGRAREDAGRFRAMG